MVLLLVEEWENEKNVKDEFYRGIKVSEETHTGRGGSRVMYVLCVLNRAVCPFRREREEKEGGEEGEEGEERV